MRHLFTNLALSSILFAGLTLASAQAGNANLASAASDASITAQPTMQLADAEVSEDEVDVKGIQAKADAGDADAQFQMGVIYAQGKLVDKDIAKASDYLTKAAMQDQVQACGLLGHLMLMNAKDENDFNAAIDMLVKAADLGDERSQDTLLKLEEKLKDMSDKEKTEK